MSDKTVILSGQSTNLYTTNERPVNMHSKMFENFPELAPLIAIFTKLSTDETFQSKIYWTESEAIPNKIVITADVAIAAATITTTQFSYVRNHDMFFNPKTFEVLIVDDSTFLADADNAIGIQKGWGSTTDAAIEAGTILVRIGNSYPESSEDSNPRQVVNSEFHNFTQEFVKSTKHSKRTMNEATHFGGKGTKRTEDNGKMFYDFRKEVELGILFSAMNDELISGASGNTKTMGGILEKLKSGTNYFNVDGSMTESKLDDWLTEIYTEFPDSTNLLAVCAPKVYSSFKRIAAPNIRISPNSKQYGLNLKQYDGAVTLDLVKHPLLSGPYLQEMMFIIDLSYMGVKYQKRPELELDVAMKRYNYVEDKLSTFMTFMASTEARHGMAVGIRG